MITAIIIINFHTPWYLDKCLKSVFKHTNNFHIILVQNSPDKASIKVQNKYSLANPNKITTLVSETNLGFVGGINFAFKEAMRFKRVCFLNSDVIVTKNWLKELNNCINENNKIVQVSPDTNTLHLHRENTFNKILKKLPIVNKISQLKKLSSNNEVKGFKEYINFYDFPGGYCNLIRTEFFKKNENNSLINRLEYFVDPNIIHGYWDEFDLTSYLRQFGIVGWNDKAYVYHYLNISFKKIKTTKNYLKEKLQLLNGLYVMNKWKDYIKKNLQQLSIEQILNRNDSYVVRMMLLYFGITQTKPDFKEFIENVPAREIGKEFLK